MLNSSDTTINSNSRDLEHRVCVQWVKIFTMLPLLNLVGSKKPVLKSPGPRKLVKKHEGPAGEAYPGAFELSSPAIRAFLP